MTPLLLYVTLSKQCGPLYGIQDGGNPVRLHHLTPTATKINVSILRIDSLVLSYVKQNQQASFPISMIYDTPIIYVTLSKQCGPLYGIQDGGNPVRLHHLTPTATKINVSSLRIDSRSFVRKAKPTEANDIY